MTRSVRQLNHDTAVPQVTCPMCKADMRLATAEPVQNELELRLTFTCGCGFDCRMSERVVLFFFLT